MKSFTLDTNIIKKNPPGINYYIVFRRNTGPGNVKFLTHLQYIILFFSIYYQENNYFRISVCVISESGGF